MKFVICDDTAEDIAFLKENLKKYYGELPGKLLISHSGEELLAGEEYEGFDLLFLDVYMKELDGIETARRLRQRGEEGKIILLTTGREFGPQSYEVGAAWYLVKPLRYEELARALEQCGCLEEKEELTLQVHVRKDQFTIPVSKIHYIETEGRQVLIHMSGKELKVYDTMGTALTAAAGGGVYPSAQKLHSVSGVYRAAGRGSVPLKERGARVDQPGAEKTDPGGVPELSVPDAGKCEEGQL